MGTPSTGDSGRTPRGTSRTRASSGSSAGARRGRSGPRRDGVDETVAQLARPLQRVLDRLPETQRMVLELRMGLEDGHPHDLADTARALGLSLSEAREIESRAFSHIREAIPEEQLARLQRFLG